MKIHAIILSGIGCSLLWTATAAETAETTNSTTPAWINELDRGKHQPMGRKLSTHRPGWLTDVTYLDLDGDGDPDVLRGMLNNGVPAQWIDDDDDMREGDLSGDRDSDCLMIDRDKDGNYGHWNDFFVDYVDGDQDGLADLEIIADNAGLGDQAPKGLYMIMIDNDKDGVLSYINWETFHPECWHHTGTDDFIIDYSGNSTLLKTHCAYFHIADLRYNWENPFLFYDHDNDGYTEMAIRFTDGADEERWENTQEKLPEDFSKVSDDMRSVAFNSCIDYVAMTFDMDNDSGSGNALDYDMSIKLTEGKMDYTDQKHRFASMRGLPEADQFFYDPRIRQLTELVHPGHDTAWDLIWERGIWGKCTFSFDEDDDCDRWERVELYEPKDLFNVGGGHGGLDNNYQADTAGDRGEWDADNSGGGNLYLGGFDGRIHLYGAEWGAWRLDQVAFYYQGFCGLRDRYQPRVKPIEEGLMPETFGTVKYTDSNTNGFIDVIEYDLDGDTVFEMTHNLLELGINDVCPVVNTHKASYDGLRKLNERSANIIWKRSQGAVAKAKELGVDPSWYAFYHTARSTQEKYSRGYWLNFYLFLDMLEVAERRTAPALKTQILKAYYSGDWDRVGRKETTR